MKNLIKYPAIFLIILMAGCIKPSEPYFGSEDGGYKIVGRYSGTGYAQDIVIKDSLAYIARGEGGMEIVNIKDPTNPVPFVTTFFDLRGYSRKIAIYGNTVYLAAGTFGLSVVDVTNPSKPVVTESNLEMKPARSVSLFHNFLLVPISEQGVKISDIGTPAHPDILGRIQSVPGYAQAVAIYRDSLLLVACGEMGFAAFDISKMVSGFETIPLAGWLDTPGYAEQISVNDDVPIAYMASGDGGLQIIDFSNLTKIKLISTYYTEGYAKELIKKDDKVYITTEKRGLQIINVANPASPKLIGAIEAKYAMGLAMTDNYIFVADEDEGLIVVSIPK